MNNKGKPKASSIKTDKLVAKGGRSIAGYDAALSDIVALLEQARRAAARSVNAIMTATYWTVGRRIVEVEQRGRSKVEYGEHVIDRLAVDLTARFGRGFGRVFFFSPPGLPVIVSVNLTIRICDTSIRHLTHARRPSSDHLHAIFFSARRLLHLPRMLHLVVCEALRVRRSNLAK